MLSVRDLYETFRQEPGTTGQNSNSLHALKAAQLKRSTKTALAPLTNADIMHLFTYSTRVHAQHGEKSTLNVDGKTVQDKRQHLNPARQQIKLSRMLLCMQA